MMGDDYGRPADGMMGTLAGLRSIGMMGDVYRPPRQMALMRTLAGLRKTIMRGTLAGVSTTDGAGEIQ